jgi:hypothetical protein
MGRGLLALHNIHVTGKWWKGKAWAAIKVLAPEWVIEMLEVFIKILNSLEEQELKLMHQLQEAARERKIPRGVGPNDRSFLLAPFPQLARAVSSRGALKATRSGQTPSRQSSTS